MATEQLVRTVATLPDHDRTKQALSRLHDAGFNMDNICVITADDNKEAVAEPEDYDSVVDRVAEGSIKGLALGSIAGSFAGLIVGLGTLINPAAGGLVLTLESIGTAVAATLSGTAVGATAGSVAGALVGLGVPQEQVETYHNAIERGEDMILIDVSAERKGQVAAILNDTGVDQYHEYALPAGDRSLEVPLAEHVRRQKAVL